MPIKKLKKEEKRDKTSENRKVSKILKMNHGTVIHFQSYFLISSFSISDF